MSFSPVGSKTDITLQEKQSKSYNLAMSAARARRWLMFSLYLPRPAGHFPQDRQAPGCVLEKGQRLALPLLHFMRFLLAHSSSFSRSHWIAALPFNVLPSSSVWCHFQT